MNERKDIRIDAVFDLETSNWTSFVLGGCLHSDGAYVSMDWRREEDFFDHLLSVRGPGGKVGNLWSHNGGRFDIKWALDWSIKKGIKATAIAAGSNIICATIGDVKFLDSKALTKISLEELTFGAGVSKQQLGLECIGVANGCQEEPGECKGYWPINRDLPASKFKRLNEYLEADCKSLMLAMENLREYARENDLDLGITVGSSAWKCAKRWLELPNAKLRIADHNFVRQAYFGGRVQLFRPHASKGHEYDVNSMYPSRLACEKLPVGRSQRLLGDLCGRAFERFEGAYRVRVNVPDMHLPALPVRIGSRICYPTGLYDGTWTRPELVYAQSLGCRILKFYEAQVFESSKVIFKSWVDKLFELRHSAKGWDGTPNKNSPIGTFLKYYANSLTGKFGAKPESNKVVLNPDFSEIEEHSCRCQGPKCECKNPHMYWKPLDDGGNIYAAPAFFVQPCGHVEWAAYLTSLARIEWHRQAVSRNDGWDLCYGDTDSVFTMDERSHNIGGALGQWEEKGEWTGFRGYAPKVYTFESAGKLKVKAKGLRLPRDAQKAQKVLESGQSAGKDAVIGFRAGARLGKFFETSTLKRKINGGYGDRILQGSGVTRAPTFKEACELYGGSKHAR